MAKAQIGRGKSVFCSFENFIMHVFDAVSMGSWMVYKEKQRNGNFDRLGVDDDNGITPSN
jgi:hypothetical protein